MFLDSSGHLGGKASGESLWGQRSDLCLGMAERTPKPTMQTRQNNFREWFLLLMGSRWLLVPE